MPPKALQRLACIAASVQIIPKNTIWHSSTILENKIVSFEDILQISKELKNISSEEQLIKFILDKKEEKDDENVYLDEQSRIDLSFLEIKKAVLKKIEKIGNQKCKT